MFAPTGLEFYRLGFYKDTAPDGAFMPEEIFDVVNERDEVVGQNTRREVHRLGLKHRAVHVLVFNSRGETFLQKRSMTKDREPGKWDSSSSGHVDSGEDYDACAVRELREEIGLTVAQAPERLFKIAAVPGNGCGICLGLSLPGRRAVPTASGRNRARRMVCAGKNHALDRGAAGGFCGRIPVDLENVFNRRRQVNR